VVAIDDAKLQLNKNKGNSAKTKEILSVKMRVFRQREHTGQLHQQFMPFN